MTIYVHDVVADERFDASFDINSSDNSLNEARVPSLENEVRLNSIEFKQLFLEQYELGYICNHDYSSATGLRVATHPEETNTCFEKASTLGEWDPLNIIKVFYLECSCNDLLYAVVVPETGCFIDRVHIRNILGLPQDAYLKKAERLPVNMSFGTCSPFVLESDLAVNGGSVDRILFDEETLQYKKSDNTIDDFSFGMDHRMSIQLNYHDCFMMLKSRYADVVESREVLKLAFKEKLVRNKGKIKIAYDFTTLNYRTARFINSIHGYGDVSLFNDYVDEMYLPDVVTSPEVDKKIITK